MEGSIEEIFLTLMAFTCSENLYDGKSMSENTGLNGMSKIYHHEPGSEFSRMGIAVV